MAKKIAVENTRDYLKKSVAQILVRRLVAEWVVPGVMIRRLTVAAPLDIRSCRTHLAEKPYVPEKLPPAEVSGCRFREPDSPTWREYHRSSVPPSQIGAQ
jgi:hypothetical protein